MTRFGWVDTRLGWHADAGFSEIYRELPPPTMTAVDVAAVLRRIEALEARVAELEMARADGELRALLGEQ